ncbi:MAG: hypothetical protein AB1668_06100 [Nanoarchaeota archaeon]
MAVFNNVNKEDLKKLKGFSREEPRNIYEVLRLKGKDASLKDVTFILYTSGKLLLQGKKEAVEKAVKMLEKLKMGKKAKGEQFRKETGWIIGTDESLKGDTFGGLVVAGVKADNKAREDLMALGVADSKELSDHEVLSLAEKIKKTAQCEVISVYPEDYNQHDGNVTKMLDNLHGDIAKYLHPGKHVVDKYPGCGVGDIQEEKAESKYVEVAAASILARAAALSQLDSLSVQAGFRLPKGSTHVKLALHELKERKLDFKKFVKMDFKNVEEFI